LKTLKTPLKSQNKRKLGNNPPARKFASKLKLEVMPNVKRLAARLETEDPNYLYSASICGKPKLLSQPSKVYSSAGAQKPSLPQWTRPTHQWESEKEKVFLIPQQIQDDS
jgi:hypothetical protein